MSVRLRRSIIALTSAVALSVSGIAVAGSATARQSVATASGIQLNNELQCLLGLVLQLLEGGPPDCGPSL